MTEFGLLIREHRESRGLTRPELAELSGVHRNTIYNTETGRCAIAIDTAERLFEALGLQLHVVDPNTQETTTHDPVAQFLGTR